MTAQAPRLDLVTENAAENVRRVQARDLAAPVVQAIFRLVKQSTLHALDNQAVVRQVEEAVQVVGDYGRRTDQDVSLLFAYGSIFVGGQLLKANRLTYEGAIELGELLKRFGYSEMAIARDVSTQDFFAFVSAVGNAQRSGQGQQLEKPSARIRLRAVAESALKRGAVVERLDEKQAIVRTYASAIVIMRRFFEQLRKGRYELPQRVKRIAQSLVDLSQGETPAFLGVTAARNANHDDAGRAVNSAILAVSMARQVTDDVVVLGRIAMAALLYDAGKPRLTGQVGQNAPMIAPRLSEAQELEMPAATAAVLTALGHVNEPTVMRTVLTYEAHWLRRAAQLGPMYRGVRGATLQARILHTARSFNDLLTPAPGIEAPSADEAVAKLESEARDSADQTAIRLLVTSLGIFPSGTVVALGSGETALVLSTPKHPSAYSLPSVRVLYDAGGSPLHQPLDLDLATLGPEDARRKVARVVSPADDGSRAQAKQILAQRAAMASGAPGPRRSNTSDPVSQQSSPFTPSGVNVAPGARPSGTHPAGSAGGPASPAPWSQPADVGYGSAPSHPQASYGQQASAPQAAAQPGHAQQGYAPQAPYAPPPGPQPQGYAPQHAQQGYAPQHAQQGYAPQHAQQGYAPQHAQQGYAPQHAQQGHAPPHAQQGHVPPPGVGQQAYAHPHQTPPPGYPAQGYPGQSGYPQAPSGHDGYAADAGGYPSAPQPPQVYAQQAEEWAHAEEVEGTYVDADDDDEGATQAMQWGSAAELVSAMGAHTAPQGRARMPSEPPDAGQSTRIADANVVLAAVRASTEPEMVAPARAAPPPPPQPAALRPPGQRPGPPSSPRPVAAPAAPSPPPPPVEQAPPEQSAAEQAADQPPTPTAEGTLTRTPLVHLLVYLLDQRLTGTALFQSPEGTNHGVYFDKGVPAKIRTGGMIWPLDRILLEMGLLDESTVRHSLMEVSKKKVLHGRYLVSKGLVDGATILKVLRQQLIRKMIHLFELHPDTRYAFYGDRNLLDGYGGPELTPAEPLSLIMTGVRMRGEDPLVDQTLQRLANRPLGLHIDAGIQRFEFKKDELAIVDLLRVKRMTTDEIFEMKVAHERVAKLTLYALAITRHLDIGGAQAKPPVGVTMRDRARRSGVVEPGDVAIREASSAARAPSPEPPQAAPAPEPAPPPPAPFAQAPAGYAPQAAPPPPAPFAQAPAPYAPQAAPPPPAPFAQAPAPYAPQAAPPPPAPFAQAPAAYAAQAAPPPPAPFSPAPAPYAPQAAPPPPPAPAMGFGGAQAHLFSAPPGAFTGQPAPSAPPPQAQVSQAPPPPKPQAPAAQAGAPDDPSSMPPPPELAEPLVKRWKEIQAKAAAIDGEDFFQMLGVERSAPPPAIQAAYFQLAKAWHPDKLPGELGPLRGLVSKVFTRCNEAFNTLSDPVKRTDYLKVVEQGGGSSAEAEQVARVVDAALEFQKAEVLLKKGDLNQAEAFARRAAEADPEQPEYRCMLAWISALRRGDPPVLPEGKTSSFYNDVIAIFDDILRTDAMYERALFYRATLLKRSGQEEKAIRDYRMVVQINPKNIDAVRELRLYQMRREKKAKDEAGPLGIGKFFKK